MRRLHSGWDRLGSQGRLEFGLGLPSSQRQHTERTVMETIHLPAKSGEPRVLTLQLGQELVTLTGRSTFPATPRERLSELRVGPIHVHAEVTPACFSGHLALGNSL